MTKSEKENDILLEGEENLDAQGQGEQTEAAVSGQPQERSDLENKENVPEDAWQERALTLEAELAKVKGQAADYYGHLQRLQAEFDNFRKRSQKEKEDMAKYASERMIVAMLPVLDNFERAVEASKTSSDFIGFAQGVEMILRQFQNVLVKEGLAPVEAVGQPFDPNIHEAVLQVEAEQPANTVVEELQKGYYLKDKLLRPSMVKVAR